MSEYWIWFAHLKGIDLHKKQKLLEQFREPSVLYGLEEAQLWALPPAVARALQERDLTRALQIKARCAREGIRVLRYWDEAYPDRLHSIEDPPVVLYCWGTPPQWRKQPTIGVVGTRKASPYGMRITRQLACQIAACGGLVISGAAAGVDTAAMEGVLDMQAQTVGVLGGGVDTVYPRENRGLYERTREHGCLLSEYPPGTHPSAWQFLRRNRLISGLSDGVLVVEAPERSGALSTARHALSQGRDIFAVPGNLDMPSCRGSNALLQEGAYATFSGWDVMKHYANLYPAAVADRPAPACAFAPPTPSPGSERADFPEKAGRKKEISSKKSIDNNEKSTYSVLDKRPQGLSPQENAVLDLVGQAPQLPDSILDASGLPSGTVQSILTRLAIKGLVAYLPDGRIQRK